MLKLENIETVGLEYVMALAKGDPFHAKYRRMIAVYVDILAPLYWWNEFNTFEYKVGTVADSCSIMDKIADISIAADDDLLESLKERYTILIS